MVKGNDKGASLGLKVPALVKQQNNDTDRVEAYKTNTVDSCYFEIQGTVWNISR